jgi:hypothetical protein
VGDGEDDEGHPKSQGASLLLLTLLVTTHVAAEVAAVPRRDRAAGSRIATGIEATTAACRSGEPV